MPKHSLAPHITAHLRLSAEERLRQRTAPPTLGWPTGTQALSLLHSMAASPATASDALKVLHELQVHQIELDLQKEQADQNQSQLTREQAHYFSLFDLAPFAYLTLNAHGEVMEANRMARAWLGVSQAVKPIEGLDSFLAPDSCQIAHEAFTRLRGGSKGETFIVTHRMAGHSMLVSATSAPDTQLIYVTFVPTGPATGH